jgi:hypothetical protein
MPRFSPLAGVLISFMLLLAMFSLFSGPAHGWHGLPIVFLALTLLGLFFLLGALSAEALRRPAARRARAAPEVAPPEIPMDDLLDGAHGRRVGPAMVVEGRLRRSAQETSDALQSRFSGSRWTPLLTDGDHGEASVLMLPVDLQAEAKKSHRVWINAVLLVATLATTTWAGALHRGVDLLHEPGRFVVGLPYALSLMAILGAHELGHYFTARYHRIGVTLPYFIPVPFALGTFGAFIRVLSPARDRRGLFDMAVAGPYAGLALAVPALLVGLRFSQQVTIAPGAATGPIGPGVSLGSSLLLTLLAKVSLGDALGAGNVLVLHPLAFAGWLGLLVTALNLLPIGQLDGGHMADAMFGRRASGLLSGAAVVTLVILGIFVWSGLLFWAFIAFFIAGRKGLPPLDDVDHLGPGRRLVGWAAFAILAAILMPVPRALLDTLCAHCPYL